MRRGLRHLGLQRIAVHGRFLPVLSGEYCSFLFWVVTSPMFFFYSRQGKLIVLSHGIPPGGPEVGMRMAGLENAHAEANQGKDALQPCPGKNILFVP
jgi:hypothetical protein